jgi:hypothetical protein
MSSIYIMQPQSTIEVTAQALVGLLCAAARVERLPARGWALEVALDVLDQTSRAEATPVRRAIARWPRNTGGVRGRYRDLDQLVRELARAGSVVPDGRGWSAGYVPTHDWLAPHTRLAALLPVSDQVLLGKAAQRLNAILSTWSKRFSASGLDGADVTSSGSILCQRVTC